MSQGNPELTCGVPVPARRLEPSGSQALGYPDSTVSYGRAENRVGASQAGSSLGLRGEKEGRTPVGSSGDKDLACQLGLELGGGWEFREAF